MSQNGYGDGSVAQQDTSSNAKATQKDRRLGSCVGGFSLVALSLTVAPPGTPAQVLAFRIDTQRKRQATWATPSHGPPAQRKFRGRPRLRDDRRVVSSVAALDARSIMWQAWHWSLRRPIDYSRAPTRQCVERASGSDAKLSKLAKFTLK